MIRRPPRSTLFPSPPLSRSTPAVKVAALDATGNTVTGFTGSVTLAIGTNPSGGTLTGGGPGAAGRGGAAVRGVKNDKPGAGQPRPAASGKHTGGPSASSNNTAPP